MASTPSTDQHGSEEKSIQSPQPPGRHLFTGSCHCQLVRYVVYLTFPNPKPTDVPTKQTQTARFRKCNCSTCHKNGFLHIRLPYAPDGFRVLSPLGSENAQFGGLKVGKEDNSLRDYTCFEGTIHWLFCGICGVKCFLFAGEGELIGNDVENSPAGTSSPKKIWRPKKEQPTGPYKEGLHSTGYLSINALTLDQGQPGCDLGLWQRNGWISYLNGLGESYDERYREPHDWGTY